MMPPTSIDGTDITGATIDGTEVQEITVDGQTVFSAAPDVVKLGNLVAWYRMEGNADDETVNQPTSGDTTDFAGTQNGGSFVNSDVIDLITGTTGLAYEFTGNEFIKYPFTDPPAVSTVAAWVFIIDTTKKFVIFGNFNSTGSDFRFFFDNNFAGITLFIDNNGAFLQSSALSTGEWYHIALTINSGSFELFVDGTSVDTDTNTLGSIDNGSNYQTGEDPNGTQDGDGRIDDLRLYDTALTQTEIENIYDATKPATKP